MRFFKIIRSVEWWEYKLPPLLAIGYATALKTEGVFMMAIPQLLFLLFALVIGAVYVSIINDMTDIEADLASGKANRMVGIRPGIRWVFPAMCLLAGLICGYFLYPDRLSIFLYLIPWISFSLYSFRPVRLKNRRIWGVLADASGSHIFTSLLMVSSISEVTGQSIDWLWFWSTGVWALCYGSRGILWHQFYDRKNDIQAGLNTYAVNILPDRFRNKEITIFCIELAAIATMLFSLQLLLPVLFLLLYAVLAVIRSKRLHYVPVLIISPENRPFHILMADFYQVFFPLALLVTAAFIQPYAWIILLAHLVLFPQKTITAIKDFKSLFSK